MRLGEGIVATVVSAIAMVFSGYTLWDTSLQQADLKIFVPPVIYYGGHQQNTNVEAVKIPITIANDGAQTGTVLSVNLEIANLKTGETKKFYGASLIPEQGAPYPFSPLVLPGHGSRTAYLLFYTRGAAETVAQIIPGAGSYRLTLTLDEAGSGALDPLSFLRDKAQTQLVFERELPSFDARMDAMPLYDKSWRPATNAAK